MTEYGCMGLLVRIDETDHLYFVCINCKEYVKVTKIVTICSIQKTTYIFCYCKKCDLQYERKIYWNLKPEGTFKVNEDYYSLFGSTLIE